MNLAIASPSASAYSETFIQLQMERLPCALRIHGGPVASETIPGGAINPLRNARGLMDIAVECGLRGKRWEGPQSKELARRLHGANIKTVLTNYGPTGVALSPLCKELGLRLIVHFHGADAHMDSMLAQYGTAYRRLGFDAAAVIAVSNRMIEALVAAGIPRGSIHLTRCGVDPERFAAKTEFPSEPLFFGVGRFVDKKAPYLTLLAFKEVHRVNRDAKMVLAGDGVLFETTRNLCATLGLERSVSFPGVLTPHQVAQWMQRSTAFVQHSITPQHGPNKGDSEGTPVAVLEALTSGLPVISTRHAGIADVVIDRQTGILVEERDVIGMAEAMKELAANPSLARQYGNNARRDALEKYTATHYIDALKRVIQSVT